MGPTVVVAAPDSFVGAAAQAIADSIGKAVALRGRCNVALCGGSTPEPVYRALADRAIDWSNIDFFFGDERAVPPDHPDSNYAMAQRALIGRVPIAANRVHRMEAERADAAVAAREYDHALPPRLDLLLLGLGPDGHTASLFPNLPAVVTSTWRVLAVAAPLPPLEPQVARMTITPMVIADARHVIMLVQGRAKSSILHRVLDGPEQPVMLPAQFALTATWIVDQAAATNLTPRDKDSCDSQ